MDSLVYGSPLISFAVGNALTPIVECLVRCGANLDLRGWHPNQSARELAREMFKDNSTNGDRRRIVELCRLVPTRRR